MLIVAVDTTTRAGSLALVRDGKLLDTVIGDAHRTHGERLPGDLLRLLARHGLDVGAVDIFAVAAGPGSFTGLRIGIAAIQGFALANRRSVVAVSALEALAAMGFGTAAVGARRPLAVWMDAQRGEVYSAVYRHDAPAASRTPAAGRNAAGELTALAEPAVAAPELTIERWRSQPWWPIARFIGDGAVVYRSRLVSALGPEVTILEPTPPLAPAIGAIAEARARRGEAVAPHAVRPIYVRRPDAELARDRQSGQ